MTNYDAIGVRRGKQMKGWLRVDDDVVRTKR